MSEQSGGTGRQSSKSAARSARAGKGKGKAARGGKKASERPPRLAHIRSGERSPQSDKVRGAKGRALTHFNFGRPTICTIEKCEAIVRHVLIGAPLGTAAAAENVNRSTLNDWLRRARMAHERMAKERERQITEDHVREDQAFAEPLPEEIPYLYFSARLDEAIAQAELRDVKILHNFTKTLQAGTWRALRFRLEYLNRAAYERPRAERAPAAEPPAGNRPTGAGAPAVRYQEIYLNGDPTDQAAALSEEDEFGELERDEDHDVEEEDEG